MDGGGRGRRIVDGGGLWARLVVFVYNECRGLLQKRKEIVDALSKVRKREGVAQSLLPYAVDYRRQNFSSTRKFSSRSRILQPELKLWTLSLRRSDWAGALAPQATAYGARPAGAKVDVD